MDKLKSYCEENLYRSNESGFYSETAKLFGVNYERVRSICRRLRKKLQEEGNSKHQPSETPKKIPSNFGLFWSDLAKNVSLSLTKNPIKKIEKHILFAEEKNRLANYIIENSKDLKNKEKKL